MNFGPYLTKLVIVLRLLCISALDKKLIGCGLRELRNYRDLWLILRLCKESSRVLKGEDRDSETRVVD